MTKPRQNLADGIGNSGVAAESYKCGVFGRSRPPGLPLKHFQIAFDLLYFAIITNLSPCEGVCFWFGSGSVDKLTKRLYRLSYSLEREMHGRGRKGSVR
jgi:hypothetical protein